MKKRMEYEKNTWAQTLERIRLGDDDKNARLAARSRAGLDRDREQVLTLIITAA